MNLVATNPEVSTGRVDIEEINPLHWEGVTGHRRRSG